MSYTTLNLGYTASAGIQYTGTTDTSADWIDVPNETYFFDKETELVYFKDASGNVIAIFESGGGTSVNIYNTSDSLTGDRVVDLNGNTLTFDATTDGTEQLQSNFNVGFRNTLITQDRNNIDFDANTIAEDNPNANFNISPQQIVSHTQADELTGTNTSDVTQNATLITSIVTDYSGDNVSQINQSSININESVTNGNDVSNIQLVYNDINQNVSDGTINQQININRDYGITLTSNDGVATQKSIILDGGGVKINTEYILPNLDGSAGQVITTDGAGNLSFTTPSSGSVTSVGLTMPNAFGVANSPVTSSDTINVTALGTASQYIRGDGNLADFPIVTGGGSSVVYYFNGGTNQGTFSGGTYYELSKNAILGANADFSTAVNGVISQFITDPLDPNLLVIPAGNWVFGTYFSSSSSGGSPTFSFELLKWDGTTFTSIANNSANPETITGGTSIDIYFSALAVPETILSPTDRLAIRVSVVCDGRTITLHTQAEHLSQVTTTFAIGLTALNGLTDQVQYFQTGTSGTDFAINSATDIHTFNLPVASATNTGKLSATDWSTFDGKADNNIYTADGTLTANRTLTFTGNNIQFTGTNSSQTIQLLLKASAGSGNRIGQILYLAGTKQIVVGVSSAGAYISNADTGYSHQIGATADGIEINGEYRFPNTDGGAGQVITTDGAGVLSWANTTSTNIYNSDGTLTGTRVVTLASNGLRFLGDGGVGSIRFDKVDAGLGKYTSYLQTINDISTSVINGSNSSSLSMNSVQYESIVTDGLNDTTQFTQQSNQYTLSVSTFLVNRSLDIATSGVSINGEYILPNADGTSGQVLTTDGAGITSWQSVSGTNIYNTNGTLTADRTATTTGFSLLFTGTFTTNTLSFLIQTKSSAERIIRARSIVGTSTRDMLVDSTSAYLRARDTSVGYDYKVDVSANGVSINGNYFLPNTDGSSNQVLTTNGAGVLSFQNAQSVASVYNTTTKTGASYTAVNRDYVLINASTFVLTLPTASANAQIGVKMINSVVTNIQIKTPSAGVTIDGVDRSSTGLGLFNQYDAYVFICDGTNWWIVS